MPQAEQLMETMQKPAQTNHQVYERWEIADSALKALGQRHYEAVMKGKTWVGLSCEEALQRSITFMLTDDNTAD